jgi:alpha-L-rhamnosidase
MKAALDHGPVDLRVEYESEPKNVDPETSPRFSWRVDAERRGAGQTAYQILVSRDRDTLGDGEGDTWDSGWVESDRSSGVEYDGAPLRGDSVYHWTVRIRDETGTASQYGEPSAFGTALGSAGAWEGDWIAHQPDPGDTNGFRSQWQSDPRDEQWVQVDLGDEYEVATVELFPAAPIDRTRTPDGEFFAPIHTQGSLTDPDFDQTSTAGFGFPRRYRVEGSTDPKFETATVLVDQTNEAVSNPGDESVVHEFDPESVRYIRVTATELFEVDVTDDGLGLNRADSELVEHQPYYVFALASLAVKDPASDDLLPEDTVESSSSVEDATWGANRVAGGPRASTTVSGSPLLRTEVDLTKPVASARAHVVGLGYGEFYVNGERIGDEVLNPGWTQYDRRVLYSTYEVGDRLHEGENAFGLWLGNGRFNQSVGRWTGFGSPRALAQIRIEYEDGTTRTVVTDASWRAIESPIVENDLYDGEVYDARREQPGWDQPGFDDADWDGAAVVDGPGGDLIPQHTPPIRITETIDPVSIDGDGELLVDVGQNVTGWLELTIDDPEPGDEFRFEHAESVDEEGNVLTVDLMEADATDEYVARGDDRERYEPRFTYHGFRYARVTGPVDRIADITAKVVHTDFDDRGVFDCSNDELAQVQHNARWGLQGNAHSVPTDNPQRSERMGWTGDAQVATAALLHNFDGIQFHEKWMDDHADEQARNNDHGYVSDTIPDGYGSAPADPTWSVTQVVVPWFVYQQYGDPSILRRHYEAMRAYVEYWHDQTEDGILPGSHTKWGDWLEFEEDANKIPALGNVSRGDAFGLYNTAYHYWTVDLLGRVAEILGNDADVVRYERLADEIAAAFNDHFFDSATGRYEPWTQTAQALPLYFGIVPDARADEVAANLARKVREEDGGTLQTGFLGTRPLILALAEYGHADVAFQIVSQPERPGWVYMVRQGATTIWERWDSDERVGSGMNSFNHSPYTLVSEWFYRALAGLEIAGDDLTVSPATVADLEWAAGHIERPAGQLASRWNRTDNGVVLEVTVPWNETATVRLPETEDGAGTVREGDTVLWRNGRPTGERPRGVDAVSLDVDGVAVEVGSGNYRFEIERE